MASCSGDNSQNSLFLTSNTSQHPVCFILCIVPRYSAPLFYPCAHQCSLLIPGWCSDCIHSISTPFPICYGANGAVFSECGSDHAPFLLHHLYHGNCSRDTHDAGCLVTCSPKFHFTSSLQDSTLQSLVSFSISHTTGPLYKFVSMPRRPFSQILFFLQLQRSLSQPLQSLLSVVGG